MWWWRLFEEGEEKSAVILFPAEEQFPVEVILRWESESVDVMASEPMRRFQP